MFGLIDKPNRLFTCIPCRGELDVIPQVGFSRSFGPITIFLYYFAQITHFSKTYSNNKLLLNHFVLRKIILQYFTHAFICFYSSGSVKKGEKIKVLRSSNFHVEIISLPLPPTIGTVVIWSYLRNVTAEKRFTFPSLCGSTSIKKHYFCYLPNK